MFCPKIKGICIIVISASVINRLYGVDILSISFVSINFHNLMNLTWSNFLFQSLRLNTTTTMFCNNERSYVEEEEEQNTLNIIPMEMLQISRCAIFIEVYHIINWKQLWLIIVLRVPISLSKHIQIIRFNRNW